MSEWIDVPVAEVAVGDEVRIDGFGVFRFQDQTSNVELSGKMEVLVVDVAARYVTIKDGHGESRFRRSSIVSVRRRKPEPQPKPGDWRCGNRDQPIAHTMACPDEWFRASGGWSRDTRDGQPWVIHKGAQAKAFGYTSDLNGLFSGEAVTVLKDGGLGVWEVEWNGVSLVFHARNLDLVDRRGKR